MVPLMPPKTRPTELEMLALTAGTPSARRVGKVTRVPDPTTVLIPPAHTAASTTTAISHHDTRTTLEADHAPGVSGCGSAGAVRTPFVTDGEHARPHEEQEQQRDHHRDEDLDEHGRAQGGREGAAERAGRQHDEEE